MPVVWSFSSNLLITIYMQGSQLSQIIRETPDFGQLLPRGRRQQKPHKLAYLTMKNGSFARFARSFFIFWHFEDVLVLSTTWNDLVCSCVDDVSICWQMFNFVFLCPKRWFQFNSRIIRTHFSSIMTLNNWKMIAETQNFRMTFSLSLTSCLLAPY